MGYPDDLLRTAKVLLEVQPVTEANVRRSISTAYYALFHLVIESACRLWTETEHHRRLARQFEHKRMRDASAAAAKARTYGQSLPQKRLVVVANAFVKLQEDRHKADYELGEAPSVHGAALDLALAEKAFEAWNAIQSHPLAQDYLFSLLFKDRG